MKSDWVNVDGRWMRKSGPVYRRGLAGKGRAPSRARAISASASTSHANQLHQSILRYIESRGGFARGRWFVLSGDGGKVFGPFPATDYGHAVVLLRYGENTRGFTAESLRVRSELRGTKTDWFPFDTAGGLKQGERKLHLSTDKGVARAQRLYGRDRQRHRRR